MYMYVCAPWAANRFPRPSACVKTTRWAPALDAYLYIYIYMYWYTHVYMYIYIYLRTVSRQ